MECIKCKKEKEEKEFNLKKDSKSGYFTVCKECRNLYKKEYYSLNSQLKDNEKAYKNLHKNSSDGKGGRTIKTVCPTCNYPVFISAKQLKSGNKRYCSKRCRAMANVFNLLISTLKGRAKKKKVDFNLDAVFIEELLNKQNYKCAITGVSIILRHSYQGTTIYDSASLDRIDSTKGYMKDNVQWVVLGINYMKMDYSENEVYELILRIKNIKN